MQTVNAESKGLGRTIFGSIDRESKIDNIDSLENVCYITSRTQRNNKLYMFKTTRDSEGCGKNETRLL